MKNTFKLKDNLFIIGKDIISYETHVATIECNKIIEHGRYSRTTTKHITFVADLLGLPVEHSKIKMKNKFDKFELGVRCFIENCISARASLQILNKVFKEGYEYKYALICLQKSISKKDWNLLDKVCLYQMDQDEYKGVKLLNRLELF